MQCIYQVRKDVVKDEDGQAFTVFGIDAVDGNGKMLESVPDISFDREEAERLADAFNTAKLPADCVIEQIEDYLDSESRRH